MAAAATAASPNEMHPLVDRHRASAAAPCLWGRILDVRFGVLGPVRAWASRVVANQLPFLAVERAHVRSRPRPGGGRRFRALRFLIPARVRPMVVRSRERPVGGGSDAAGIERDCA